MMSGLRGFVLPALLSAAIGTIACGRGSNTPATRPAAAHHKAGAQGSGGMQGGMVEMCPMMVEGTRVTVDDTAGGVAMVFTTTTGDVVDLRARVRRMAEMYARMSGMMGDGMHQDGGMHGKGGGMHGGKGGMHGGKGGMMGMVASDANAVDIESGARMELRPRDPNQLDELRAHARTQAQQMASGQCPMMSGRGPEHAHR